MNTKLLRKNSLTREILFIAGTGVILLSSLLAPNVATLIKPLLRWKRNWGQIDRRRIHEAVRRLNHKRLIKFVYKDGKKFISITNEGKEYLRQFEYDDISLSRPPKWDGKWRLVLFDIPEYRRDARGAFQSKLKELGFLHFQKSVWVYPYECQDEVDYIADFWEISEFVNYIVTNSLDNREGTFRGRFGLL